jgi:RHS repeat-associated protein
LVASLLTGVPAVAAPSPSGATTPPTRSVPVGTQQTKPPKPSQTDGPGITSIDRTALPVASSTIAVASGPAVDAGGMPVSIRAVDMEPDEPRAAGRTRSVRPAVSAVRVQVADQALARTAGVRGVVLSLSRVDGMATSGRVRLQVGYAKFGNAYGADYGARLRLVSLPSCVLTTPQDPKCQVQTDLGSVNNAGQAAVSADVAVAGGGTSVSAAQPMVVALTSSSSSDGATWSATPLSPAYSWAAGGNGGEFSYSYPLRVPPSLGGPAPQLALAYSSGAVDSQTTAQNGQTSWVGEGWDLQTGFIERSYRSCRDDGGSTGDLCWSSLYNATMVFGGRSTALVRDNTSGVWHAADDDALRIERLNDTSLGNGDDDGEHWKVTTQDGTQYFFGRNKRYATDPAVTNSTLLVPVYGNNQGEPCNSTAGFAASSCPQAYRWNLDYVVDPRGNTMTYFYTRFSGYYGHNNNTGVAAYDLSATLDHIDYGTRAGSEGAGDAPTRVVFDKANRCFDPCDHYPDTPWDLYCSSNTSCPSTLSPVFFTPYRLVGVAAQVWNAASSGYRTVDRWNLTQTFPPTGDFIPPAGDDTAPHLWLQNLTHVGYAADGTTLAEPTMSFGGSQMFNRVDWGSDIGVAPYVHYRLTSVLNGVGGQTLVAYSAAECFRGWKPVPAFNPLRCFPQYFKPVQAPAGWGWFHKYVVTQVTDRDLTGGAPDEVTTYTYSTAGASDADLWHHDMNETSPAAQTSWALWRGYPTVTATRGPAGGPQTVSTSLYFRGMDGDQVKPASSTTPWAPRKAGLLTPLGTANATGAVSGVGGLCLEPAGGGTANGTTVQVAICTGAAGQVWQHQPDDSLKNPASGRCLDVVGAGTAAGTRVQIYDCNGGVAQVWGWRPDGTLINPNANRCLDVSSVSTAPGTPTVIWDCGGYWNQRWMPQPNGSLVSPQAYRCAVPDAGGTTNGTRVVNAICALSTAGHAWQYQTNSTLKHPASGRCLDIEGGGTAAGTGVLLWDCHAGANQIWQPQPDGTFKNPASGRCLDAGTNATPGLQLTIRDCTGVLAQQWNHQLNDTDGLAGFLREQSTLDGATIVASTIHTPTVTQTAVRSPWTSALDLTARMVRETTTNTRTRLAASATWRWTQTTTTYDSYGLPTNVTDLGDLATGNDDTCARTTYATRDTTRWMVNYPTQVWTTDCAPTLGDADYLSGTDIYYDNLGWGVTPTRGLVTKTNALASVVGGVRTWKQATRADYDTNGRPIAAFDELDRRTTTAYTPASGGPVTQIAITNPKGWTTTTNLDPVKDVAVSAVDVNDKTTTAQYDPLGRLTKVWLDNRPSSATPDREYRYNLSATTANSVESRVLSPSGGQISSFELFDGMLRQRQVQEPTSSATGGRMISDTVYDGRGLVAKVSTFWNNTSGPSSTLVSFADANVPTQHRYSYDSLERRTADQFYSGGTQRWQHTSVYDGDRAALIPPAGGTTTQTRFDAMGNVIEQRQYTTSDLSGSYQATSYTYDRLGHLTAVTDPAGNRWTRTLDLRDRLVAQSDPDAGTSTFTYDDAGQMLTATDARGITLAYTYDALGRRTNTYLDSTSGTLLASSTFDSLAKGELTSSTSYVSGNAYTVAVTGYDDAYRGLGISVTIPAAEGGLAGTWTTTSAYNVDGSPASISYPAAGGLAAETVTYTYDANGFQLTATGQDTYVSASTFQPWGDLYQLSLGATANHKRVLFTTDEWTDTHRAKTIQVSTENQTTAGTFDEQLTQRYNWDPAGDLTSVDTQRAGATTDSQCFSYDWLQQLTTAWTTTPAAGGCAAAPSTSTVGGPDAYWTSWTYDNETGNRTSQVRHGLGGAGDPTTTYTYPAAASPKPHTIASTATTGPGGTTNGSYIFNNAGQTTNTTIGGLSTDYTWTSRSQVGSVTVHAPGGDQTTTYVYDALGNQLIRKGPAGRILNLGGTEITADASGTLTGATRYYIVNGTVVASRSDTGGLTWLAADHQGTSQVAIDATTLQTSVRKQDPFGNPRGTSPTWPNKRGFVGGSIEVAGLVRLGIRLYDPTIGRFISPDPITNVANPQQINGYTYADNNPTTNSDPSGLASGGIDAHSTAIMLRMQALRAKYPDARLDGTITHGKGPDLVCWGCAPGEVWVWEFKTENNRAGAQTLADEIQKHMDQAKADRLSAGMHVVAGPTFTSLGLPPIQSGSNVGKPQQVVIVYDRKPGLQYYRTGDQDENAPLAQKHHGATAAAEATAKAETDVTRKLRKQLAPPQRRGGSKPSVAPPTAVTVGANWTSADDYREAHRPNIHPRHWDSGAVRDDPISGWLIAGAFGLLAAATSFVGGGGATVSVLVPAVVTCAVRSDYCLAA